MLTTLSLAVIDRDQRAYPRAGLYEDRVAQFIDLYEEDGAEALPPIQVIADREGRFVLADGWHRFEAAITLGWTELPASIVEDSDDA